MTEIIHGTPKTEVYVNELGGVCIRQENNYFDDDPYIYFSIEEADAVIQAIKNTLQEAREIAQYKNEGGENDRNA